MARGDEMIDAEVHHIDKDKQPEYFSKLLRNSGLSINEAARRIGVNRLTIRRWCNGEKPYSYTVQYTMEQIAKENA